MERKIMFLISLAFAATMWAQEVKEVRPLNRQAVEVMDREGHTTTIDFYGPNVFRLFRDDKGGILRDPEATPPATILVEQPRRSTSVEILDNGASYTISSKNGLRIDIAKVSGLMSVVNDQGKTILRQAEPVSFAKGGYDVKVRMADDEYFFGGGVQNGRFSHRGQRIQIVNTNSWTDGGVCSPAPMFWSTAGYGVLCHTFRPGYYDFGSQTANLVDIHHDADYLDLFVWAAQDPVGLLRGYYQLTGDPVLLPKFAFYEGHLNAYNRDYWKETDDPNRGILYEDGKYYTESQKAVEGGIRESLNGDAGDYQFSARAVIDRYQQADMPLGWVLPNDGYGAGYGQTESLDGNIANLKAFGDYAREKGVEIGLWTQSNLHPIDSIPALLQRDIVKEVRDAGVRVLKTDVAWVGAGYSFGLNGIADVAQIMPYYGNQARPFIISLDGWAGTQRYAGIWTGDQTGGEWEYIRFHIPTYIGAGLSGMPNITSDTDGIFGGRNMAVNIRDFQWKTFTPMQLNMDGWGSNPKYPQALGEPATSINRTYLKWKSMLLPYTYTYAYEAITGKPLIRAMLLDDCNDYTLGQRTQYQFLYGPWILVAPIYEDSHAPAAGGTPSLAEGEVVRNGIYLPEGTWYDYFTGEAYRGGQVLNSFAAPLWKLPVFAREGAIIPMNYPNNNPAEIDASKRIIEVYPSTERTDISVYDDDGTTDAYLRGECDRQLITQHVVKGRATVTFPNRKGQATHLLVNVPNPPKGKAVKATVNGKTVKANWTYGLDPVMDRIGLKRPQQLIIDLPETVGEGEVKVTIDGVEMPQPASNDVLPVTLSKPQLAKSEATAYTLTPTWKPVPGADFYEMEFEGMTYGNIRDTHLTFDLLQPETDYHFHLRAVNKQGLSDWTDLDLRTDANPLEFAMKGLTATCTVPDQPGNGIQKLFDLDERGEIWHSSWSQPNANPFTIYIDMHAVTVLDRLQYIPRDNAGNGTLLEGAISLSRDGRTWSEAQPFRFHQDNQPKTIQLKNEALSKMNEEGVRYLRLDVVRSVGGFGSGAEFYAFRKADAKVLIPGDINQDGKIDENDLTSYLNYTGLRRGDGDFDGYVSVGDVNQNGLIDAQDISNVATLLEGGAGRTEGTLAGNITLKYNARKVKTGDEVVVTVVGRGLQAVNALNLVLPYNQRQLQFLAVEPLAVSGMANLTNDRLHTNGDRVLYPTFVNIGRQPQLEGNEVELFRLRFKALAPLSAVSLPATGMLVDRSLNALEF